jgi:hypothetical protein
MAVQHVLDAGLAKFQLLVYHLVHRVLLVELQIQTVLRAGIVLLANLKATMFVKIARKVMRKVQVHNLRVQFVPQARNVKIRVQMTQRVFLLGVLIVILVIIKMNKGKTIANRARLVIILELLPQLRVVPIVFPANTRLVLLLCVLIANQVNLRMLCIKQIVAIHVFPVVIKRARGKQVVPYVVQLRVPIRPKNIKTKQDKQDAKIATI